MLQTLKNSTALQLIALCSGLAILNLDAGIHAAVLTIVVVTGYGFYRVIK